MKFPKNTPVIYTDAEGNRFPATVKEEFNLIGNFVKLNYPHDEEFDSVTGKSRKTTGFIVVASPEDTKAAKQEWREREMVSRAKEFADVEAQMKKAEEWYNNLTDEERELAELWFEQA